MRGDKEKALKLRLVGKSYSEIHSMLGIPKSTLSGWLSCIVLSENKKKQIFNRTNKKAIDGLISRNKKQTIEAIRRSRNIQNNSRKEIGRLTKENLFYIGVSLYWAEGYKRLMVRNGRELTYHPISLTNSDPYLVKIFVRFLREVCDVSVLKIKASLRLYKHINESTAIKFWSEQISVPVDNFGKTYYGISKSSLGKKPFNRLPYGTIQVRVADTKLFHKIIGWIAGLKNSI